MSNLKNTNTKLPAEVPKHKRARMSPRLQKKYRHKGQVGNLPTDSQPDSTETLDFYNNFSKNTANKRFFL